MRIYMAPLEGITVSIYRNAYEKFYGQIDKYFAPFISPSEKCPMIPKVRKDLLPENNVGIHLVPQILTCKSDFFIDAAKELVSMGYRELNLNLGCPSGTVCAKRKGAGFLLEPDLLRSFLNDIYNYAAISDIQISIKTRLGYHTPEEFYSLLQIFNDFPASELIVHPRIRSDYYKGEPRYEYYAYALEHSKNPLVYNGNLFTQADYTNLCHRMNTEIDTIMLGRGLISDPSLVMSLRSGTEAKDFTRFWAMHDVLYEAYRKEMVTDTNIMYRMKDLWSFWKLSFEGVDREIKALLKAKKCAEYESILRTLRANA